MKSVPSPRFGPLSDQDRRDLRLAASAARATLDLLGNPMVRPVVDRYLASQQQALEIRTADALETVLRRLIQLSYRQTDGG